ncbi:enoyl-CoA hydratase/isomerase family protein [Massilia sp. B-10]|nr:enoyl-CoA hydratase/isomerase family protein [Massilia sp. B-10]
MTFHEDDSVRIWHQNDDVLIISLKTKMHVIGEGVIRGLIMAQEEAAKNFKGLVIWNSDAADGGAFSAGCRSAVGTATVHARRRQGHGARHRTAARHLHGDEILNVPVVAAVAGLALGGGCEMALHASKRVASIESYIGLVEVGVGLIPA